MGVAVGAAALGYSEDPGLRTCWVLGEVGLVVGYPDKEGVGGEGSAVSPPCTCSSIICLEERKMAVSGQWRDEKSDRWGRG